MAEQTINAPASWASLPNPHAVEISAPSGSRPAIDNSLKANEGDERRFGSLDMQGAGSLVPGRFVLNISTATGSSNNLDLSSTFEMLGSVEITVQGRSLLVALAGADTREPYVWTPANSAEVIAFEAYVRGLAANQRAATITLRGFCSRHDPGCRPVPVRHRRIQHRR